MTMRILIAVDGSTACLAAVQHALALVRGGLDADFVLANVQAPPTLYEVVVAHDPVVIDRVRAAAGADLLRAAEAMVGAAGRRCESEVAGGDPGHVLAELAENYRCDAIFAGSRGMGSQHAGREGRHVGAVARALLHATALPVTVVHPPEAGEREGPLGG